MQRILKIFALYLPVIPALQLLAPACGSQARSDDPTDSAATVFEGARLITGDGSAPIDNSAFIVQNKQFTQIGRKGELQAPVGAAHRLMYPHLQRSH